ncbi:translation elongation factor Ts [Candidatus Berkelbacteria bacterium RBG_13_40_8]|uniref:Elongation factor Ts n=1 Tax=Candidatus Berkelbacteria bacterium RBG_13_40_8 TaxID=1797467 RepID=A0A1F5DM69_9BACT|nr:MAG: translation elongation factor Ts [Candidatus Berkelbacteria bacterium RBG_13_40_8]
MSAQDIAKLRSITGAGVMDCKKALEETDGDFEKAKKLLSENAATIAKKKAERATNHGAIEGYLHGGKIGVLVEVLCESDFVAKNLEFKELTKNIAMQIASMNPKDVDELLKQEYIKDPAQTIEDYLNSVIAQIKENIKIKRFVRYELGEK